MSSLQQPSMELNHLMPVHVITGQNVIARNSGLFRSWGKRCLIVTGRHSAKACGALDDVTAALDQEGIAWDVFDKVGQNPLLSVCVEGGRAAAAFGADFLIGIGGGSPLDATKAIAVFATNDMDPMELYQPRKVPPLPFILVGTTAGTGSEVTCYSVLTVDATGRKRSWGDRGSYAQVAFGDPRYTLSLNRKFTISTALDAFSHAMEGYFSKAADPVSDAFAILAMELLVPALQELRDLPEDGFAPTLELRERLYAASIYGGMTINKTGTAFCHQMGYTLTEDHGVPHGQACAVFLPEYIRRGTLACPDKAQRLFARLGVFAGPLCQLVESLTEAVFPPYTPSQVEELLARWDGSKNMVRSPGEFNVENQRKVALAILAGQEKDK